MRYNWVSHRFSRKFSRSSCRKLKAARYRMKMDVSDPPLRKRIHPKNATNESKWLSTMVAMSCHKLETYLKRNTLREWDTLSPLLPVIPISAPPPLVIVRWFCGQVIQKFEDAQDTTFLFFRSFSSSEEELHSRKKTWYEVMFTPCTAKQQYHSRIWKPIAKRIVREQNTAALVPPTYSGLMPPFPAPGTKK